MSRSLAFFQGIGMVVGSALTMCVIGNKKTVFRDKVLYNFPGMDEGTYISAEFKDRGLTVYKMAEASKYASPWLFHNRHFKNTSLVYEPFSDGLCYVTIDGEKFRYERAMVAYDLFSNTPISVMTQDKDKEW